MSLIWLPSLAEALEWTYYEVAGLGIQTAEDASYGYFCAPNTWTPANSGIAEAETWTVHFLAQSPSRALLEFGNRGCDFVAIPVTDGAETEGLIAKAKEIGLAEITPLMAAYQGSAAFAGPRALPEDRRAALAELATGRCAGNAIRSGMYDCACVGESLVSGIEAGDIELRVDDEDTVRSEKAFTRACINAVAISERATESCQKQQSLGMNVACPCAAEGAVANFRDRYQEGLPLDLRRLEKSITDAILACKG